MLSNKLPAAIIMLMFIYCFLHLSCCIKKTPREAPCDLLKPGNPVHAHDLQRLNSNNPCSTFPDCLYLCN